MGVAQGTFVCSQLKCPTNVHKLIFLDGQVSRPVLTDGQAIMDVQEYRVVPIVPVDQQEAYRSVGIGAPGNPYVLHTSRFAEIDAVLGIGWQPGADIGNIVFVGLSVAVLATDQHPGPRVGPPVPTSRLLCESSAFLLCVSLSYQKRRQRDLEHDRLTLPIAGAGPVRTAGRGFWSCNGRHRLALPRDPGLRYN